MKNKGIARVCACLRVFAREHARVIARVYV